MQMLIPYLLHFIALFEWLHNPQMMRQLLCANKIQIRRRRLHLEMGDYMRQMR